MTTIKDEDGRIAVNCDGTVIPRDVGGPDGAGLRNHCARTYFKDKDPFSVVMKLNGVDYKTIATGIASAKAGKLCSIFVSVRGEADVDEPVVEPEA